MTLFYFKKSLLGLCLLILLGVSFAVPQALQAVEPFPQGVTLGELKVFVIEYIPEDADNPGFIDPDVAGTGDGVDQMISRLNTYNTQALQSLTESTIYKGYTLPPGIGTPAIRYVFHGSPVIHKEAMPQGLILKANKGIYRPNYRTILNRENVCDLVDNQGVKQIWLWGYHHGSIEPTESNLSMGTDSRQFFNYSNYGDISNSERTDDLPQCQKTYAVFVYSMTRAVGEMFEDHTHHAEAVFNYLDGRNSLHVRSRWPQLLFWGRFVGSDETSKIVAPGCGWTHYPPNGIKDYDWFNTEPVQSDCLDWKPDGGGQKTAISCTTWSKEANCPEDGGWRFKVWWFQNFPGLNNGLSYKGKALRNWWETIYDFDRVLLLGGGLYKPEENVVYTVEANQSGGPSLTIRRQPEPLPTQTLKVEYKTVTGATEYQNMLPICLDTQPCFYSLHVIDGNTSSSGRWVSWKILHDPLVPVEGSSAEVRVASGAWHVIDPNSYHTELYRENEGPTVLPLNCRYETDLTGDGRTTAADLTTFISRFIQAAVQNPADINCNNQVDIFDYNYLLAHL